MEEVVNFDRLDFTVNGISFRIQALRPENAHIDNDEAQSMIQSFTYNTPSPKI